jgi:hypothetical protein
VGKREEDESEGKGKGKGKGRAREEDIIKKKRRTAGGKGVFY